MDRDHAEPVLVIRNLNVSFRRGKWETHVLRSVDLTVERGEILAVVGESGSGKSTLGLTIQGLLAEDANPLITGSVCVKGHEMVGVNSNVARMVRRRLVRAVFQDPLTSLNPTLRIGDQLSAARTDDTSPAEWLERVGITRAAERLRSFPHQLSGGQRQRVLIAMAMAGMPSLVVADEPTTALDVTVQAQILKLFKRLRDESGTAFIFITHDLAIAADIADRVLVLYAGRVAELGPVETITTAPAHPYTAAIMRSRFDIAVDKARQLPTLEGEPPTTMPKIAGCVFAPRCPLKIAKCEESAPPLMSVHGRAGEAACFRSDEVAGGVWKAVGVPWEVRSGDRRPAPLVSVIHVSKSFRPQRFGWSRHDLQLALKDVSLEVAEGESVGVVGESGSGKTTLLRIVAGLVRPDQGEVRFSVGDRPQLIYQDAYASLTPWLTVDELVGERLRGLGLSRQVRARRVADALHLVGLRAALAGSRPPELSGGQRQRVAIARATVVPPKLLLCDEPVSAIDVSLAAAMLNLLHSLRLQLGMAMLFVTHDLAAARYVADRIAVLRMGEIVELGDSEQVTKAPTSAYTRELLSAIPGRGGI